MNIAFDIRRPQLRHDIETVIEDNWNDRPIILSSKLVCVKMSIFDWYLRIRFLWFAASRNSRQTRKTAVFIITDLPTKPILDCDLLWFPRFLFENISGMWFSDKTALLMLKMAILVSLPTKKLEIYTRTTKYFVFLTKKQKIEEGNFRFCPGHRKTQRACQVLALSFRQQLADS